MDITRRTDYALRMITELVQNPDGAVSVRTASRDAGVPYSFARSIQHDLAQAGLVVNARGASGGMRLAVDPKETTLLQLVEAIQGPVSLSNCLEGGEDGACCPNRERCRFRSVWGEAEKMLCGFYSSVTLHQLIVERLSPSFDGAFTLVSAEEGHPRSDGAES